MGLITNFLHKKGSLGGDDQQFLVMVALSRPVQPTEKLLHVGLGKLDSPTSVTDCSGTEGTISCTILDSSDGPPIELGMCAISLMPAPIPWPDLESACAHSWHWPEAEKVLRAHSYHW